MSDFVRGQKIICVDNTGNNCLDLFGVYTFEDLGYSEDLLVVAEVVYEQHFVSRFKDYETWCSHQKKAPPELEKALDEALNIERYDWTYDGMESDKDGWYIDSDHIQELEIYYSLLELAHKMGFRSIKEAMLKGKEK